MLGSFGFPSSPISSQLSRIHATIKAAASGCGLSVKKSFSSLMKPFKWTNFSQSLMFLLYSASVLSTTPLEASVMTARMAVKSAILLSPSSSSSPKPTSASFSEPPSDSESSGAPGTSSKSRVSFSPSMSSSISSCAGANGLGAPKSSMVLGRRARSIPAY
ncbi:hypothetical protein B0H13DRAFT_1949228 [Mycena leptocephala]|nr:hypothetical protein B0H13DRAFT_1949228 [Mycena leptocephala]